MIRSWSLSNWDAQPDGFPDYPHRGIETVTLNLDAEPAPRGQSGYKPRPEG
jgi:hypothetical protein